MEPTTTASAPSPPPWGAPPPLPGGLAPPPPPGSVSSVTFAEQVGTAASKASDTGSIKDSASDAGSTATDYTSMSQGTLVSGASTAFYPPQVHFFSLDDFAGHEIGAILEDGEAPPEPPQEAPAEEDRQSVRPGSIVSNIEHRLDELEGAFQGDAEAEPPEEPVAPPPPSSGGAGSSSQHLAESLATELHQLQQQQQQQHGGGGGGGGAHPQHQQTVESLLAAMQYRDLTPADLALLRRLQDEAASLQAELHDEREAAAAAGVAAGGPAPAADAGPADAGPPAPRFDS